MTLIDKSAIHRMLGKIEGVAFVLEERYANPLLDAVEVIDSILDKDGADAGVFNTIAMSAEEAERLAIQSWNRGADK